MTSLRHDVESHCGDICVVSRIPSSLQNKAKLRLTLFLNPSFLSSPSHERELGEAQVVRGELQDFEYTKSDAWKAIKDHLGANLRLRELKGISFHHIEKSSGV
jgi:hypothetical protein